MRTPNSAQVSRQLDLCVFCAIRYGINLPPREFRRAIRQARQYHTSQKQLRPPYAAAVEVEEDNRTPSSFSQRAEPSLQYDRSRFTQRNAPENTTRLSTRPSSAWRLSEDRGRSDIFPQGQRPPSIPDDRTIRNNPLESQGLGPRDTAKRNWIWRPEKGRQIEVPVFSARSKIYGGRSEARPTPAQYSSNNSPDAPERSSGTTNHRTTATHIDREGLVNARVSQNVSKHAKGGEESSASGSWGNFGNDDDDDVTLDFETSMPNNRKALTEDTSDRPIAESKVTASPDATHPNGAETSPPTNIPKAAQSSGNPKLVSEGTLGTGLEQLEHWAKQSNKPRSSILRNESQLKPPDTPITSRTTRAEDENVTRYQSSSLPKRISLAGLAEEKPRWEIETPQSLRASLSKKESTQKPSIAKQADAPRKSIKRMERFDYDFADEARLRGTSKKPSSSRRVREPREADEEDGSSDLLDPEEMWERKKKRKEKKKLSSAPTPIMLPNFISVERLAKTLRIDPTKFLTKLGELGYEDPSFNDILDFENSSIISQEFNFEPSAIQETFQDLQARPPPDLKALELLPHRPPIVTIMGHVDHGKTTILDWLRKSSVAANEHGGITQHIGAFSVNMPGGEKTITFLDTPGHAAFLEMRRRGAVVTDIVVLVVAADDSVKPQTIEAIKHARESCVPIIVAINKVDKGDANIERVKQDLARHEVEVESFGGDTQAIPLSGKTGQGMLDLEEAIIAESENLQTQVEFDGPTEGWIIETTMTLSGRVATVLVRRGTMKPGDIIVAGTTWSRIRTLKNDAGVVVDSASPGTPVVIDGWRDQPEAGAEVLQANSEDHAKEVVEYRLERQEDTDMAKEVSAINAARQQEAEARAKVKAWEEENWAGVARHRRPLDNVGWVEPSSDESGGPKRVDILIKADVAGSVEAVVNAVSSIGNNEIATNVIDASVGSVNESDIQYLSASGNPGFIVSFNRSVDGSMARRAETAGLEILNHNIIYKVSDDLIERLGNMLPSTVTHKVQGEAEIGQIFSITVRKSSLKIAGCKVTNGSITRERKVKVLRNKETVHTGTLHSLKHIKKDVTEARNGTECGMGFDDWDGFEVGDQVQSFDEVTEKRKFYM